METQGIRWNIPIFLPVNHLCFGVLWHPVLAERLSPYKPGPSQFPFNQVWTVQPLKNQWGVWFMENSHVCLVLFVRPTCCKKANPGIRIPWSIRAGYKNVLPGFLGLFFWAMCYGLYRYQNHHETPPFWENSFGTLSKALPSTTATLHCLGGFEATNGQAMPSCTAAGAPEGLSNSLCWRWVFFWEGRWGMRIIQPIVVQTTWISYGDVWLFAVVKSPCRGRIWVLFLPSIFFSGKIQDNVC